jgi:ribosomal-protein-alanine N-acetyltransferase
MIKKLKMYKLGVNMKHKGTKTIETERLILRKFNKSDSKDMFDNWCNDKEVTEFLSWKPRKTISVTEKILNIWLESYKNDNYYQWAIVYKKDKSVIGSIATVEISDLHNKCEIGYCIGKRYWNKGIMTESARAVVEFLFTEVGVNRIEAIHHKKNKASGEVMKKIGMSYEGDLRDYNQNIMGEYVDCSMYSILKSEL